MKLKKYNYLLSTNTVWCSFDGGTVEAEIGSEALRLASEELTRELDKANAALAANPETKGMDISMDLDQIEITEVKEFSHVVNFNFVVQSFNEKNLTAHELRTGIERGLGLLEGNNHELLDRTTITDTVQI